MKMLLARADQLARAEERKRIGQIAQQFGFGAYGITATETEGSLILHGRGLLRRWLADPALRFMGRIR